MDTADNQVGPGTLGLDRSTDGHGQICLVVTGQIDISNVDRLREALTGILAEPDLTELVLDFGALEFIDSSGVGALVRAKQEADSRGANVTVTNAHGPVERVLTVLGVDEFLTPTHQDEP
jgi:anti-sigma B factor antagonist